MGDITGSDEFQTLQKQPSNTQNWLEGIKNLLGTGSQIINQAQQNKQLNYGCGAAPGIFASQKRRDQFDKCLQAATQGNVGTQGGQVVKKSNTGKFIFIGLGVVAVTVLGIVIYRRMKA